MNLSEHFTLEEMIKSEIASRKGLDNFPPQDIIPKLELLCIKILEPIREFYNVPIRPNSGYRNKQVNELIGGSKTSQHCKGEAVDIEIPGESNYDLAIWIKNHLEFDQLILECYIIGQHNSGWVHVSYRKGNNRNQVLTYSYGKYISGLFA